MANKRFTDTNKWRKPFMKKLSVEEKLFWIYLTDKCSNAGIWDIDFELAEFELGISLNQEIIYEKFSSKIQVVDDGTKWFIPSFIEFQQPNGLKLTDNFSKSIIKELEKYNISYETLTIEKNQTLTSSSQGSEVTLVRSPSIVESSKGTGLGNVFYDSEIENNDNTDFDKFVSYFPQGKNYVNPHDYTIWGKMSSRDIQLCLQLTPHYIKHHSGEKQTYIKPISKFLNEGFWNTLFQFQTRYLGKKVELQIEKNTKPKRELTTDELMEKYFPIEKQTEETSN